jgi:hypothetical protein
VLLNAGLAQSAERGANNATVTGSSPVFRMCTFLLTAPIKQLAIVHLVNSILKSKKMGALSIFSQFLFNWEKDLPFVLVFLCKKVSSLPGKWPLCHWVGESM